LIVSGVVLAPPLVERASGQGDEVFEVARVQSGSPGDGFGSAIAVSADGSLIVGAPNTDTMLGFNIGRSYLYQPDGAGAYALTETIASPIPGPGDTFGGSVAISDTSIVIGSSLTRDVYEFSRNPPSAGVRLPVDGRAVSTGSPLLVAQPFRLIDNVFGVVSVLTPDGAGGYITSELVPSNGAFQATNSFGFALDVAIEGDTIVVGARLHGSFNQTGAAYVYERRPEDGVFVETAVLKQFDQPFAPARFGQSVAISGDKIVVGAPGIDTVYVFEPNEFGGFNRSTLVASDGAPDDSFGFSVAASGDRIVVGASRADTQAADDAGAAYVFDLDDAGGYVETKLVASDSSILGKFGFSVDVADDTIVATGGGGAYIFDVAQPGTGGESDPLNIGGSSIADVQTSGLYGSPSAFANCAVDITGDMANPTVACFGSAVERDAYLVSAGLSLSQPDSNLDRDWLATHTRRTGGGSLSVIGAVCADSVDLRGTRWNQPIRTTLHGCPAIEYSTGTPGAFGVKTWSTEGDGATEQRVPSLESTAFVQYLPEIVPQPEPQQQLDILIVGDSYSAGNGSRDPNGNPVWEKWNGRFLEDCLRGAYSWGRLYEDHLKDAGFVTSTTNVACSDNVTINYEQGRGLDDTNRLRPGVQLGPDDDATGEIATERIFFDGIPISLVEAYNQTGDPTPLYAIAEAREPGFTTTCVPRSADEILRFGNDGYDSISVHVGENIFTGGGLLSLYCERALRPQAASVTSETDLILMTYGGNDIFFSGIVKKCLVSNGLARLAYGQESGLSALKPRAWWCKEQLEQSLQTAPAIEDRLLNVLTSMRTKSECNARVVLLAYPALEYDDNYTIGSPIPFVDDLNVGERLVDLAVLGEAAQTEAVRRANDAAVADGCDPFAFYQDGTRAEFDRKEPKAALAQFPDIPAVSRDYWIWVPEEFRLDQLLSSSVRMKEPYHPTQRGHEAERDLVVAAAEDLANGDLTFGSGSEVAHDLDVVFVVNTGSTMTDELNSLKVDAQRIVDVFQTDARSARFGLVSYGSNGVAVRKPFVSFTPTSFPDAVDALQPDPPGPPVRTGLLGIQTAVDGLAWRDGVKKVVILITDTPSNLVEPETGATPDSVRQALFDLDPAELYTLTSGEGSFEAERAISEGSGGFITAVAADDVGDAIETLSADLRSRPFAWAGDGYQAVIGETVVFDGAASFDVDGELLSFEWDLDGNGEFEVGPLTIAEYEQSFAAAGSAMVALRVTDDEGNSHIGTARLTVSDIPVAPGAGDAVATDDVVRLDGATSITIDVFANDQGDLDPYSVSFEQPYFGEVRRVVDDEGSVKVEYTIEQGGLDQLIAAYTSDASTFDDIRSILDTGEATSSAVEADEFQYSVCAADGSCDYATVVVEWASTVIRVPPTANTDTADVGVDSTVLLDVLGNDVDIDGTLDSSSLRIVTNGSLGTASIVGSQLQYVAGDEPGLDAVIYEICDTDGKCSQGTVDITVSFSGVAPIAADDHQTVFLGSGAVLIDVLANDQDSDGDLDPESLIIVTPPQVGTASVDQIEQAILYSPANGEIDELVYEICDQTGLCSQATVTIEIITLGDCTIVGTSGDDILTGTDSDDIICGLAGNDTINGLGGDDRIFGGPGSDTIRGNGGNDYLVGGRGADKLIGGSGSDVLRGRRGNDILRGGSGSDLLRGGRGKDRLFGGAGQDTLFGGAGKDYLNGGTGNDFLAGRRGNDTLYGSNGRDTLKGGRGTDTADGGGGYDTCRAEETSRCERHVPWW